MCLGRPLITGYIYNSVVQRNGITEPKTKF